MTPTMHIVLWIACGLVTALVLAFMHEVHIKKEVSWNVLMSMIAVTLIGWAGLFVLFFTAVVVFLVWLSEDYGSNTLFKWGKKDGT